MLGKDPFTPGLFVAPLAIEKIDSLFELLLAKGVSGLAVIAYLPFNLLPSKITLVQSRICK